MLEYSKIFKVTRQDLDDLKHVNNIRYVEWIQEISKQHWFHLTDETIRDTMVWVVKKHTIEYYKSAVLDDEIKVNTYIKGTKGPISVRAVEIKSNKTGQILVNALTEWCLLDVETLRPKRVPESIINLFTKQ